MTHLIQRKSLIILTEKVQVICLDFILSRYLINYHICIVTLCRILDVHTQEINHLPHIYIILVEILFYVISSAKMKVLGGLTILLTIYFSAGSCMDGIQHPCPNYDKNCIGRVFAREMRCPLRSKIPDSRSIKYLPLNYPSSNFSIVYTDTVVKGLNNFTIKEFYINRRNKTLVLEVIFKEVNVQAPNTIGFFYRKGKEAIVTSGYTYTIYRDYSVTLTVFNVDGRNYHDPSDYQVYTYINEVHPVLYNDESFVPKEPEAKRELDKFFEVEGLSLQEEAVNQGPLWLSYILPCDLKISMFQDLKYYDGCRMSARQ
nr:fibrohexamerin-like protein 7 [Pseudoips prasinana]